MPDAPKTQHRSVRVPDERWDKAAHVAAELHTDRAKLINDFLAWLTRETGATMPKRPPAPKPD
ncbi:hypothetical protein N8J89_07955 [Crossiella sp. CA-258035]|uniref:hypothetical protein n=1 Tax=Crossiella sp. CA-258035 TaxID=2981138 RepID=UPI0024BC8558|nr:hypothetical protein [Crossiella sp. CA-258035]WHT20988.1 hypothetical protein N8J89_07955 [Crossiella sp. CA-258035]